MRRMVEVIRRVCGHRVLQRALSLGVFLTIMAYSVRSNYQRPEWNFDLVGYVAVVTSYLEDTPEQIHKSTYDAIRQGVPAGDYNKLLGASGYRKSLSQHASHLMTQVRLYRNKPGYLLAVYVVHKAGANLARATFLVSLIAYVLLAFLLWRWLALRVKAPWASVLCVCIMLSHPVFLTARMSAPDMLVALVMVPALLLLLDKKWARGGGLLLLAMTIRPDVSLFIALLGGASLVWPPAGLRRRHIAAFCAAALCMHFTMHFLTNPYPHRVLLKHALADRLFMPSQVDHMITWTEYVNGLSKSIFVHGYTLYPTAMWSFGLLAGIAILLARRQQDHVTTMLVACCCAYVILHIGLFPIRNDRFFCAHYIFIAMAAIHATLRTLERREP
jgi:hypothetical protein